MIHTGPFYITKIDFPSFLAVSPSIPFYVSHYSHNPISMTNKAIYSFSPNFIAFEKIWLASIFCSPSPNCLILLLSLQRLHFKT